MKKTFLFLSLPVFLLSACVIAKTESSSSDVESSSSPSSSQRESSSNDIDSSSSEEYSSSDYSYSSSSEQSSSIEPSSSSEEQSSSIEHSSSSEEQSSSEESSSSSPEQSSSEESSSSSPEESSSEESSSSSEESSSSSANEEEVFREGDFDYIKTQYGLSVVSYYGNNKIINIPETINGETVTGIGCPDTRFYVGDTRQTNYRALKAILPKTVKRIDESFLGSQCPNVTSVEGLENIEICNQGLGNVKNAVFSDKLKEIGNMAFQGQEYVTIPDDISSYPNQMVGLMTKRVDLIRGKGEQKTKSVDGVIYSIDGKSLLCYPSGRDGVSYTIPDSVTTIAHTAFDNLGQKLSELIIPSSVINMNSSSLGIWNCNGCEFVVEPDSKAFEVVNEAAKTMPSGRVFVSTNNDSSSPHNIVKNAIMEYCEGKNNEYDKALALHDWLIDYVEYDYSYTYTKAPQMLKYKTGICAAYADAYHWLLSEAGIENEVIGNFEHAWIGAKLDGEWTYIDPTWDDVYGDELDTHTFFGFDNTIRNTVYGASYPDYINHRIAYLDDINASSVNNHYFVKKGYLDADFTSFKNKIQDHLNGDTGNFTIAADIAFTNKRENVSYMVLSNLLSNSSYVVNGEEYHVDVCYDEQEFKCYPIKKSDMDLSVNDYDVSIKNGMVKIDKYRGSDSDVVIPDSINGLSVGYLGRAFAQNIDIISVKLPDSVKEIDGNAFIYCLGLESVNIPSSIKTINDSAFAYCQNLLSDIILPEGLTYLGSMAFARCSNVTKVVVPSTVESFRDMAFMDCVNLSSVTLTDGLQMIGAAAFSGCANLKEIVIPDSVTEIMTNAFGNSGLASINIPANVSKIGLGPLGDITPGDVFFGLRLSDLTVDSNNQYYKIENNALIHIESHLLCRVIDTKIEKEYHVADGVTSIGLRSFVNANKLETLYIPTSVTTIESQCFCLGCDNLKTIVYAGTMEQWNSINISNTWNQGFGTPDLSIVIQCSDGVISQ